MSNVAAFRRMVSAFAAVMIAGCTTAHELSGSGLERLRTVVEIGDRVRATSANGVTQEFEITAFEDDGSLRGVTPDGESTFVRAADLTTLEYRGPAPAKTTMLVLGAIFGAMVIDTRSSCDNIVAPCE
jgi:hypothetical protein